MYFHPPTFDPGPVAALIGLGLLAFHLLLPLVQFPLLRRLRRQVLEGERAGVVRMAQGALWLSLAELLAVVLFVGSAASVTAADIGFAPLAVHRPESDTLTAAVLVMWSSFGVFVALGVRNGLRAGRVADTADTRRVDPAQLALLPRRGREMRWTTLSLVVSFPVHTAVVYAVFVPLLMTLLGDPMLVLLVLVAVEGWGYLGRGAPTVVLMGSFGAMALFTYLFVLPGSLLVPLLYWALFVTADRMGARGWYGYTGGTESAPMEVTMLDAEGNPVPSRGR
ncbi:MULTISPECIES: hypothetical protein [unclassified Nocardiopsis]|uniref:hypothetical protein n=1 Tax=unclassified Nocardiopsis TaxID=2649073 RepID=UPI00135A34CB|nr:MULTISPECIES: hypothetical protein [unclassified Nocardiopsis]